MSATIRSDARWDARAQQLVLGKQRRQLTDPPFERCALPDDGAAAAQRDRRKHQKEAERRTGHRQPSPEAGNEQCLLQAVGDFVELGHGDHFARPGLQDRGVNFQQRSPGTALGPALETRDQRAGESRLQLRIGIEALARQRLVLRIEDRPVAAPQPKRVEPSAQRSMSERLVERMPDRVTQYLALAHVRQDRRDDAVDVEGGRRRRIMRDAVLDHLGDDGTDRRHRDQRHHSAGKKELCRQREGVPSGEEPSRPPPKPPRYPSHENGRRPDHYNQA